MPLEVTGAPPTPSKGPLRGGGPRETALGVRGLLRCFWRRLSEDGQDGELARNRVSRNWRGAGPLRPGERSWGRGPPFAS